MTEGGGDNQWSNPILRGCTRRSAPPQEKIAKTGVPRSSDGMQNAPSVPWTHDKFRLRLPEVQSFAHQLDDKPSQNQPRFESLPSYSRMRPGTPTLHSIPSFPLPSHEVRTTQLHHTTPKPNPASHEMISNSPSQHSAHEQDSPTICWVTLRCHQHVVWRHSLAMNLRAFAFHALHPGPPSPVTRLLAQQPS